MQNTTKLNGITGNIIWTIIVSLLILGLIQPTKAKAQSCATPVGLSHTALTSSSERANWTANPLSSSYQLRYAEVGSTNYVYFTFPGGASVSNYTLINLKSSTAYYWQIRATCSSSNSRYSATDTFTTMAGVISCVKLYGIYSASVNFNTAVVGWDSTLVADQFRVRYAPVNCPSNYSYALVSGGTPGNYTKKVTLTNLAPGTQYNYQIAPICGGTQYSYTTAKTFSTPLPAVSIAVSGGAVCPGTIPVFTATQSQPALYLNYQWKVNGQNVGQNQTTFTGSSLVNGDVITCQLIPQSGCAAQTIANSNAIVATNVTAALPFVTDFSNLNCWSIQHVSGTPVGDWEMASSLSNPSLSPLAGTGIMQFRSSQHLLGAKSRLISPVISFSSITDPYISISMSKDNGMINNPDYVEILISTNNGGTWSAPLRSPMRYSASATVPAWNQFNLDLSPFAGHSEVRIAIQAVSEEGKNMGIDAITIANATCRVPKNRNVNNITGNTALINWTNVGGSNYKIKYVALTPGAVANTKNNGSSTSFTLNALQPNTQYAWWVSSSCGSTTIGYQCFADTFTTGNGTIPCVKPGNLSHNLISGNTVQVSWNPAVQADSFKIRYAEIGSSLYSYMKVAYGSGSFGLSNANIENLFINTTYFWQVASECGLAVTAYSASDTFTTPSGPAGYLSCMKPFNISSSNVTANDAVIHWDTLIIADSFRVRYAPTATPNVYKYTLISGGTPGAYVSNMTIDRMMPGTQYNYQVKAICNGISTPYSDPATFTTDVLRVAVIEAEKLGVTELSVYPNPTAGDTKINFTSDLNGTETIRILDNTGRMIFSKQVNVLKGSNSYQLESSGFDNGVYTLLIIGNKGIQKTRFVITK